MSRTYIPTIGIECHVQLKTKTKLFAAVDNDARDAEPNTRVSPICFGLPGTLPYLNEKAVEYAIRAGLALNVDPQPYSIFERKHYFYPDLPMGYQITQLEKPIIKGGFVEILVNGETKKIRINRVQLEADAGKSIHPAGADYTLVDLNRAGTPLLEIVSEPGMHSPEEAKAYVRELYLLMKYAGVSDVDLYHGNMRFDVNLSLALEGSDELGTRTETKNLNSFKAVEKAAMYEIRRQTELLQKGEKIVQETRGWDDAKQKTVSQRSKEEAHDYRYFPDPDIPPVEISNQQIEQVRSEMPKLPPQIREELSETGISSTIIETLLEYKVLIEKLLLIEANCDAVKGDLKRIADWFVEIVIRDIESSGTHVNIDNPQNIFPVPCNLVKLSKMVDSDMVSASAAKGIIAGNYTQFRDPEVLAKEKNLIQVSDISELEKYVEEIIAQNPQAAQDVRNGEMKAVGFLTGQVMKLSRGQANPAKVQELLKKYLE